MFLRENRIQDLFERISGIFPILYTCQCAALDAVEEFLCLNFHCRDEKISD